MPTAGVGPLMQRELERYGIGSLGPWLSNMIITGASEEQMMLELYERPEFKARFPAIETRRRAGLSPVSVDEYLEYEAVTRTAAKALGVDVSQEEINGLLSNDVSAKEAQDRLSIAARAVYRTDANTRDELNRLYGVTTGDLVRYWLDPKKEAPVLERRFATAMISGEARRSGFQQELNVEQLEYLYGRGMEGENAAEAFGKLVANQELFESVDQTEQDISVDDQLKVLTGDVGLSGQVAKRGEKRAARFQEGGQFSTGSTGVSGLGSANT